MRAPVLFALSLLAGTTLMAAPAPIDYARLADGAYKGTVQKAVARDRQLGVRELFVAALYFCRSGRHLDALDTLFQVAAEMQDRRPESRGCGNFRWYWRDGFVMDYNAVDFCMEQASLIARDHLDKLTPAQRKQFDELLDWSIRGSLAHRVRDSYTNIALMNAANLVLLGEVCNRPDVFAEGVKRLDAFLLNTALVGVCEYASPTYTAVDLAVLHRLHGAVRDASVKDKAARLLRLFWTDIAASSFPDAGRLGGAHSRDYDYLYGRGGVPAYLRAGDLIPSVPGVADNLVDLAFDTWRPDAAVRSFARTVPRLVTSVWGDDAAQNRVYWAGRHVALGVAGANYGNMDIPLAVDFASTNLVARGYFIADGRRDPYGRKKIPEGTGPHQKTLHLKPFWAGVQRTRDALGLVVYRPQDLPPETPTLESHFVLPSDVDEVWVDETRVTLAPGKPFARELGPGATVAVRKGAGACAVRVPWSRDWTGGSARAALVWEALGDVPACRVTVAHQSFWGVGTDPAAPCFPGAAFWVRVCDAADRPQAFARFRRDFAAASASGVAADAVRVAVTGEEGPLSIEAKAPFDGAVALAPLPPRAVLAVNGRDVGAEILGEVPGLAEARAAQARARERLAANRLAVGLRRPVAWEAEKGAVVPKMQVDRDRLASGGAYVWAPGEAGGRHNGPGRVSWQLDVQEAGTYYLWGRVNAPTPEDDSFFVQATAGEYLQVGVKGRALLPRTDWSVGVTKGLWHWSAFPVALELPQGPAVLTLSVREDGTKIDRLLLTAEPDADPRAGLR